MRTPTRIDSLARRLLHELAKPIRNDLRVLQLLKELTNQDGYRPAWIEKRGGITSLCLRGIPGLHQSESVLLREIPGSPFYERVGNDFENVWFDLRVSLETYLASESKPEFSNDGLSADGRTLYWGGAAYPIGPTAVGVIRLLVEAYRAGKPYLSQDYLMEVGECETELRAVVKNHGLQNVLIRQIGQNDKPVKGMWGLADPATIKKESSTRKVPGC